MKNETKHTPGPWIWEPCEDDMGACEVMGEKETHVAWTGRNPEGQANARLISAAPELLEALELTDEHLSAHYGEAEYAISETAKLIRQALAKARGE